MAIATVSHLATYVPAKLDKQVCKVFKFGTQELNLKSLDFRGVASSLLWNTATVFFAPYQHDSHILLLCSIWEHYAPSNLYIQVLNMKAVKFDTSELGH